MKVFLCCSFIIPPNKKLLSIYYYQALAKRGKPVSKGGVILTLKELTVRWSKDIQHSTLSSLGGQGRACWRDVVEFQFEWWVRTCCDEVMGVTLEKPALFMCFSCWVLRVLSVLWVLICRKNIPALCFSFPVMPMPHLQHLWH